MIDYRLITYKESTICIVENRYSIEELLAALEEPELYIPDLGKLKTEHRKREFLAIRIALKMALQGEEKQIEYSYDGKPMLTDGSFQISFSHCQNSVAVMVHPSKDVGIDIESPSQKLERIYTRFLGSEELAEFDKYKNFNYLRVAWSVKEAMYKIIGDPAYNFAEQLRILPFELKDEGQLITVHTDTNKKYLVNYLLTNSFTLAYCIDDE